MAQPSNWIRFTSGAADAAPSGSSLLAELSSTPLLPLAEAAAGTFSAHAVHLARQRATAMVSPDPHGLSVDERAAISALARPSNSQLHGAGAGAGGQARAGG